MKEPTFDGCCGQVQRVGGGGERQARHSTGRGREKRHGPRVGRPLKHSRRPATGFPLEPLTHDRRDILQMCFIRSQASGSNIHACSALPRIILRLLRPDASSLNAFRCRNQNMTSLRLFPRAFVTHPSVTAAEPSAECDAAALAGS